MAYGREQQPLLVGCKGKSLVLRALQDMTALFKHESRVVEEKRAFASELLCRAEL